MRNWNFGIHLVVGEVGGGDTHPVSVGGSCSSRSEFLIQREREREKEGRGREKTNSYRLGQKRQHRGKKQRSKQLECSDCRALYQQTHGKRLKGCHSFQEGFRNSKTMSYFVTGHLNIRHLKAWSRY